MPCGQTNPKFFYGNGPGTGNPNASPRPVKKRGGSCSPVEKATLQSDLLRSNGNYGYGVLLRGNNLLVGEPRAVGAIFEVGEVHYYSRPNQASSFTRQTGFHANTQSSGQLFGQEIAANDNLDVIAVGSPNPDTGDVWTYTRSGTTITFDQEINPNTMTNTSAQFGQGIAMDSTGVHMLIGAPSQDTGAGGTDGGGVEYWEDVAGTWTFRQGFFSGTAYVSAQRFGRGIAMSSSTEAFIAKVIGTGTTRVERWTRSGTTWTYQDNWTLPYGTNSVSTDALSMDFNGSNRLIFGFQKHDAVSNNEGLVVITDLSGNVISSIDGDTLETEFGRGVTIDADEAVIGEWLADPSATTNAGTASVWDVCV